MDQRLIDDASDPAEEADATAIGVVRKKRSSWLRRLRPRFVVRDMFWIILISALLMTWYRDREDLIYQLELRSGGAGPRWGIAEILGPPNTPQAGDQITAWASASPDASLEWVIVEFPWTADATKVEIVETYNPGAVVRICSVNAMRKETELWKGKDPTPTTAAMGRSVITLPPGTRTRRLKIYINSGAVPGWNEIDAVALHDRDSSKQWASNAWASSCFGDNQKLPGWFWP